MSWFLVLPLALAAFALAAFAFRLDRGLWTTLLAALVFGLAGYALQAHPGLPGATPPPRAIDAEGQWGGVQARQEMLTSAERSGNNLVLISDGLLRHGQFANAATLLGGAVRDNPTDGEAWLALGNALVEHADGALTPAAIYAYRRAAGAAPGSVAPGYFLGLALIRQGRFPEARAMWAATLADQPQAQAPVEGRNPAPRSLLAERLARLDALLANAGVAPPATAPSGPTGTPPPANSAPRR